MGSHRGPDRRFKVEDPLNNFLAGSSIINSQSSPGLDPIGPIGSNQGPDPLVPQIWKIENTGTGCLIQKLKEGSKRK